MDDRLAIANRFVKQHNYQLPMVVDTMNNTFQKTFAAWPIRYYVIHQGKVVYKAQPDATSYVYNINELSQWLTLHA
jgi:hypothetical protein